MDSNLTTMLKRNIVSDVSAVSMQIDLYNKTRVDLAKTIAINQQSGMFGNRQKTADMLESMVEAMGIYNAYVIYEPNADGQDEKYRNAKLHNKTGRFNLVFSATATAI